MFDRNGPFPNRASGTTPSPPSPATAPPGVSARLTLPEAGTGFHIDLRARPHRIDAEAEIDGIRRRIRATGDLADRLIMLSGTGAKDIAVKGEEMPDGAFAIRSICERPARPGRKRVLVFGDSNTWGWASTGLDQPCERLPDGARWTCVASRLLGSDCEVIVDGLVNRTTDLDMPRGWGSVSGEGFNGMRSLEVAIARTMPLDAVVIALGTNDLQRQFGREAPDIAAGIARLVAVAEAAAGGVNTRYPAPRVLVVAPPRIDAVPAPRMGRVFAGAETRSVGLGAEIARALPDLPLIDLQDLIGAARGQDGIHLTATEHYVLGAKAAEQIRALLSPERFSRSLQAEISLRESDPHERAALAAHLKRLSDRSRALRFGHAVNVEAVEKIVRSAAPSRLYLMRHHGTVRGAVELYPISATRAEIGLSVEDRLQGQGLGRRLFAAGIAAAHEMGVEQLLVICVEENAAMRRLVEVAGGAIELDDGEVTCWLDVPRAIRALRAHCTELARVIAQPAVAQRPTFAASGAVTPVATEVSATDALPQPSPTNAGELRALLHALSPFMQPYLNMQRRTFDLQRQALEMQRRSVKVGISVMSQRPDR
ncbi:GNAT family N-acetyltransferase [Amaricoccus macauensis]|uniref:GNAT family N-acetyltransferase n=1 Tax=Amaricoccus macauensis TaxID=57001 RepID=UPI003C7C9ED1